MSQDLEKNSRQTFSWPNSFLAILEVWLAAHRCPTPGDRRQQFKGSRYSSNTADSGDQQTAGTGQRGQSISIMNGTLSSLQ
jgi:hypothetical protein